MWTHWYILECLLDLLGTRKGIRLTWSSLMSYGLKILSSWNIGFLRKIFEASLMRVSSSFGASPMSWAFLFGCSVLFHNIFQSTLCSKSRVSSKTRWPTQWIRSETRQPTQVASSEQLFPQFVQAPRLSFEFRVSISFVSHMLLVLVLLCMHEYFQS